MDHVIDARELEPPEPMERTLDALATLPPQDRVLLRLPRQPFPLFDLLRRMGYLWEVSGSEGDYWIAIRQADAAPLGSRSIAMVWTAGLSLDQAPPIHLPLRLLLTAPWLGIAAGVLLTLAGEKAAVSRWMPASLAFTHLITVGVLGQTMCGALLQMLPVIAGAPVPRVRWVASTVHPSLAAGALLMAAGFLGAGAWSLVVGAALAAAGFAVFTAASAVALVRGRGAAATLNALRLSVLALVPTVLVGVTLSAGLAGSVRLTDFPSWVAMHLSWGLFGWVGLLILGASYQVVPMFYVTPSYPPLLSRWLAPALFATLVLGSVAGWTGHGELAVRLGGTFALGFGVFAVVTLDLQRRRSRPRRDATLLHWWSALGSMLAAAGAWALGGPDTLVGALLLVGVAVGLPSGMLLKIVPFLCWFHLQQHQVSAGRFEVRVPHMHGFLPERPARWQWGLHLGAVAAVAAASAEPRLAPVGGILLALASAVLAGLLLTAVGRYRKVLASLAAAPR